MAGKWHLAIDEAQQPNVVYDELLRVGGGVHQHRHKIGQSILKVNNSRDPIQPSGPTGIRRLTLYSDQVDEMVDRVDPDGNWLEISQRKSLAGSLE